jgi:hypothetical protein
MATAFNIGSSSTISAGKITITVGAGGVPQGSQIFVVFAENSGSGTASVADSASNTYFAQATSNTGIGVYIFRETNLAALVNGNTIVITLSVGATLGAADAFYVVGLKTSAIDASQNASGSSSTPSVTSTTPTKQWDFFVGAVAGASVATPTQDSTNGAWSSPPGVVSSAAPVLVGGTLTRTAATAQTYAPTLNTSDVWCATIVGYLTETIDMNSQSIMAP